MIINRYAQNGLVNGKHFTILVPGGLNVRQYGWSRIYNPKIGCPGKWKGPYPSETLPHSKALFKTTHSDPARARQAPYEKRCCPRLARGKIHVRRAREITVELKKGPGGGGGWGWGRLKGPSSRNGGVEGSTTICRKLTNQ